MATRGAAMSTPGLTADAQVERELSKQVTEKARTADVCTKPPAPGNSWSHLYIRRFWNIDKSRPTKLSPRQTLNPPRTYESDHCPMEQFLKDPLAVPGEQGVSKFMLGVRATTDCWQLLAHPFVQPRRQFRAVDSRSALRARVS